MDNLLALYVEQSAKSIIVPTDVIVNLLRSMKYPVRSRYDEKQLRSSWQVLESLIAPRPTPWELYATRQQVVADKSCIRYSKQFNILPLAEHVSTAYTNN